MMLLGKKGTYMSMYYTGKRARHYNTRWHTYTVRTLEETKAMIDVAALRFVPQRRLLAPGGQLVVEDFARREPLFLWVAFEWLLQRIERSSVRAYSLAEAQALCQHVELHVASGNVFKVDWLWHGWVIRAYRTASEAG
jgi:hypothetical protein